MIFMILKKIVKNLFFLFIVVVFAYQGRKGMRLIRWCYYQTRRFEGFGHAFVFVKRLDWVLFFLLLVTCLFTP